MIDNELDTLRRKIATLEDEVIALHAGTCSGRVCAAMHRRQQEKIERQANTIKHLRKIAHEAQGTIAP